MHSRRVRRPVCRGPRASGAPGARSRHEPDPRTIRTGRPVVAVRWSGPRASEFVRRLAEAERWGAVCRSGRRPRKRFIMNLILWSVRRELWEHRWLWSVPLAVGAIVISVFAGVALAQLAS